MTKANDQTVVRRAARASFIGNFVEWFDYATYGFLAAVIGRVFFPESNPAAQLLSAFAVFAISFILRPIGAVVWGSWGDKHGRRWALSWSILLMAGSTFLLGLVPGYATIGILAPLLLLALRMVQGFSASGEYAGAATFLAEFAPRSKRGFYTSLVPASTATGLLAGSLLVAFLHMALSDVQLESWGWRIPFLMAGPMGLIGRYIRMHLDDTPVFREFESHERGDRSHSAPVSVLFRLHFRTLAVTFGVSCLNAVGFYMLLSYMPTYLSQEVGVADSDAFVASSIMLICYVLLIFVMGRASDRFGRKNMLITACICFIVFSVPLFFLLDSGSFAVIVLAQIAFCAMLTMNDGTLPTFLAESFPTEVRYTGFAVSFNMANALLGGTAPFVATWLISMTGSVLAPAWYLTAIAVLALGAMVAAHQGHHLDSTTGRS